MRSESEINSRKCCKCGEIKPLDDFNRDNSKPLGRTYKCNSCTRKTVGPPKNPRTTKRCEWCLICFSFKPGGGNMDGGKYCSVECRSFATRRPDSSKSKYSYPRSSVSFIECKWCGKLFCSHSSSVICSSKCRKELARAKEFARNRLRKKMVAIECKECGGVFTTTYGVKNNVFCSSECGKKNSQRICRAKRDARQARAKVESVDPRKVFRRDRYVCQLCGKKTIKSKRGTTHNRAPELDHIIPLSKGGDHSYRNTQCSCRSCNGSKSNRSIGQLRLCG